MGWMGGGDGEVRELDCLSVVYNPFLFNRHLSGLGLGGRRPRARSHRTLPSAGAQTVARDDESSTKRSLRFRGAARSSVYDRWM